MSGVRARARAELSAAILATARRHLAEHGAAGLSLRAIARELGMVSSAIYRYVPSRDHLLTTLIVEGYDDLGATAERADAACPRADVRGRWMAIALAAYRWAREHPATYGLLFGAPVPGYRAPADTIAPASRFTDLLLRLLADGVRAGLRPAVVPEVPAALRAELDGLRATAGLDVDDEVLVAGMQAWTALFGAVSFLLFGQFQNVIEDQDALAESMLEAIGRQVLDGEGRAPTVTGR